MSLVRLEISSIVVGGGSVASMVILKPHRRGSSAKLPIRIGKFESTAISMGIDGTETNRPLTHDLMKSVIGSLGARLVSVVITEVHGTIFYAQLRLISAEGDQISVEARPSDAIALAVRAHVPIFAEEEVVDTASLPDFSAVEAEEKREELERFHDFVEGLSPEDFEGDDPEISTDRSDGSLAQLSASTSSTLSDDELSSETSSESDSSHLPSSKKTPTRRDENTADGLKNDNTDDTNAANQPDR